jgi:peptidoglycan/xylan/chitin deacetylase (PgdA/CDA1 family)
VIDATAVERVPATLPVLMYHSVSPGSSAGGLQVPLRELREHLAVLQDDGFELTGLTDALRICRGDPGRRVIALTFDDGYADFLAAAELLVDRGCGATLYVPTAHVGTEGMIPSAGRLLDWADLATLPLPLVEVGSHSHLHRPLDVLPDEFLRDQARTSRELLAERLGVQAVSFCFPHGYARSGAAPILRSEGYTTACVIGRRVASPRDDVFAVPRVQVRPGLTPDAMRALVRRGEPGIVPHLKAVAAPAWRLARAFSLRTLGREFT